MPFFHHIPHLRYIWMVAASTIAGVMNAMAGGGSFISFPAMLGVGVLPVQANATNTVALWPGQLTSLATLRNDVRRDLLPTVLGTCLVGAVLGAETLLHTAQNTFLRLIPWLILIGTVVFGVSGPLSRWMRKRASKHHADKPIPWLPLSLALLPICFYIGYFGAGGGFLVMTVLALFGMEDMHELNAMKVVAATTSNFVAIVTFVLTGAVLWHYCLISMVFAGFGGWGGAKFAKRVNGEVLRGIVVATGSLIAAYFFWRQYAA
nr:sulfite exporter TauE/SafE family protein [Granulicella cerasi]